MARRASRRNKGNGRLIGVAAVVLALGAAGYLLLSQDRESQGGLAGVANDVSGTVGGIVSAPVRWVQGAGGWIGSYFGGAARIRELEAQNQALLQWRDQARAMAERLDAYEQLNAARSERLPKGVTGRMVAESAGPFSRSGLVNAGSDQGVAANWIVLNQNGLVGRVISVGQTTSRVILLSDSGSRVPVMGEASRARAIVVGDKTAAPQLEHLNLPSVISDNERLMTSGDDGLFPRGLAVGTAGKGPDGRWRVRLASARAPVDFVTLIPPSDFPPPADDVTLPALPPAVPGETAATAGDPATATLPLTAGAAPVPAAATPQAIAQAQRDAEAARIARKAAEDRARALRAVEAERDAARAAQRRAEAEARAIREERSGTAVPASPPAPAQGPAAANGPAPAPEPVPANPEPPPPGR